MRPYLLAPAANRLSEDTAARISFYGFILRVSGVHQIWISLLSITVALLSMAPLELQRRIINQAIGGPDVHLLLILGSIYFGVAVTQSGLKYVLRLYQSWLGESATRHTREQLLKTYEARLDASAKTHGTMHDGQAVSVIGFEVEKVAGFVGEAISEPLVNAGMLVVIFGYMVVVDTEIALICLAFLVPQIIATPIVQRYLNRLIQERVVILRQLGDQITHDEAEMVKIGEARSKLLHLDEIYANRMRYYLIRFLGRTIDNLSNAIAPISALVVGGYFVIQGQASLVSSSPSCRGSRAWRIRRGN
jgi:ABC-type bacteriocin/lantibiotic exporter with double-glycine peptidase domain